MNISVPEMPEYVPLAPSFLCRLASGFLAMGSSRRANHQRIGWLRGDATVRSGPKEVFGERDHPLPFPVLARQVKRATAR